MCAVCWSVACVASSSSTAAAAEVIRVPFIRSRDVTLGKISLDGIHDSLSTSVAWRDGARATEKNEQTLTSQDMVGCNRNRTNNKSTSESTMKDFSHDQSVPRQDINRDLQDTTRRF